MKAILIRNAKIIDPESKYHETTQDLLVADGIISSIGKNLKHDDAEVFEASNLHVSRGWIDMRVTVPDPGFEQRETLRSAIKAAADGGITLFCCTATAEPARDSKADMEYVLNRTAGLPVTVLPMGALSEGRKGKDLAEMYDMKMAGAVAFGDDKQAVTDTGLLSRALDYSKNFNGLVMSFPYDPSLSPSGKVNEGITSTMLGLKGIPAVAEELAVARDLKLAEYTGGRLHFATISTAGAVQLIREAKGKGIKVSAEVSATHLLLQDELLHSFDSNLKLLPPLRDKFHQEALINGLKDGTIEVICSDHFPLEVEEKDKEFDLAAYGALGLQTLFGAARQATANSLSLEQLLAKITVNPARLLQIECPGITEGNKARLTIFDPDQEYIFREEMVISPSKNTPLAGIRLKGVPLGVINNNTLVRGNQSKSFS